MDILYSVPVEVADEVQWANDRSYIVPEACNQTRKTLQELLTILAIIRNKILKEKGDLHDIYNYIVDIINK